MSHAPAHCPFVRPAHPARARPLHVCSCGAGRRSASRLPAAIVAVAVPQRASPLAARPPPTDRVRVERKPAPRGRGRRERNQRRCQGAGGSGFFASGRSLSIDKA